MAEADRAGARVRLLPERERAAAEHLRPRLELHVDLEADHRLEAGRAQSRPPCGSKPIARSSANAASSMPFSEKAGPAIWNPTGSAVPPSAPSSPAGVARPP